MKIKPHKDSLPQSTPAVTALCTAASDSSSVASAKQSNHDTIIPLTMTTSALSQSSVANELAQNLCAAIHGGHTKEATKYAAQLANLRASCDIKLVNQGCRSKEAEFSVKVVVEDRESSGCSITLTVRASDTIADLKRKVMVLHNFPTEVQRWIIGKKIHPDETKLFQCGVKKTGHTLYLYLVTARSVGLNKEIFEAQQQAITSANQARTEGSGLHHFEQHVSTGSSSATSLDNPAFPHLNVQQPQLQQQSSEQQIAIARLQSTSSGGSVRLQEMLQSPALSSMTMTPPVLDPPSEHILNHTSPALASDVWGTNVTANSDATSSSITMSNSSNNRNSDTTVVQVVNNEEDDMLSQLVASAVPSRPPVDDEEVEGWSCPICTYRNLPMWPGCEICNQQRPEDYQVPPGYELTERERKLVEEEQMLERLTREEIDQQETARMQNYQNLLATDDVDLIQNPVAFQCAICFDDIEAGDGIVLRECLHQFCRECLTGAVQHCEEATLKCPYTDEDYSCNAALQEREIRALVPEELYFRFLQRGLDQAEVRMENSYHCKTPNCHGWCVYEDMVNFFNCPVCSVVNCLTCKAIHTGKNCQQYQEDLRIAASNDINAKATHEMLQALVAEGEAMHCPQCQVILQKKGGCDWLRCSICHIEICWVTKGPRWGPGGDGDISGGCKCRVNGKKCHPQCQNCH